jgi:hypothetical protein
MIPYNRINARQKVRFNKTKRSYLLRSSIADFSRMVVALSTPPRPWSDGKSMIPSVWFEEKLKPKESK